MQEKGSVLVSGAGPVGLTIAMDLARRGVPVTVAERRSFGQPPSVRCNHVASRTMEAFRRLGLSAAVRNSGLPPDYPNDCVYKTSVVRGPEITRVSIPSRAERNTDFQGPDTWWPTPEPAHRINQIFLEPVMFAHAAANPLITILNDTELTAAEQTENEVRATLRDLRTGESRTITAPYLVGCDGGRSLVRNVIGAKLSGDAVVQRCQSTYIRAPKLLSMISGRPGWMNLSLNPRRSGNTIAIDGRETWLIHNYLYEHEQDFDAIDRDKSIRTILGVDESFEYDIISHEDWIGRRLIADKFRDRRIFVCGDSAHIWVPYAGYGMNAGIADAMNLSWLLAATLQGWGGSRLLNAYEAERLPITGQVSHFAMNHAFGAIAHRRDVPPNIENMDEAGQAARKALGEAVYALNVQQYCCGGLNYGYFYDKSPIIAYDGEEAPGYTMSEFTPSTVPGCRTPHFWLRGGQSANDQFAKDQSAYDAFGPWYTLLRFDPAIAVDPLVEAATMRGVPFKVMDVRPDERILEYREGLVLSRPDLHVAWRGNAVPENPLALMDLIRGG